MKPVKSYDRSFEIREETLTAVIKCECRILYLSDLHLTKKSGQLVAEIINTIHELKPDILLLGGDYIDSCAGLVHLKTLVAAVHYIPHVIAIPGNHDRWHGLDKFAAVFKHYNRHWLYGNSTRFLLNGQRVTIDTAPTSQKHAGLRILLLHKPINVSHHDYNLVFAGHLHGCQVVLWETDKGLYPGRWFYKWNRLKLTTKDGLYLISKGLGDTIPIRYNCPKDMLFVTVKPA